jgi:hypothetical protein
MQKATQYVYVLCEGQTIEPPTAIVGQVESERSISVPHILNRQHCKLKFQRSLC